MMASNLRSRLLGQARNHWWKSMVAVSTLTWDFRADIFSPSNTRRKSLHSPHPNLTPIRAAGIVSNQRNYHLNYSRPSCRNHQNTEQNQFQDLLVYREKVFVKLNQSDENLII